MALFAAIEGEGFLGGKEVTLKADGLNVTFESGLIVVAVDDAVAPAVVEEEPDDEDEDDADEDGEAIEPICEISGGASGLVFGRAPVSFNLFPLYTESMLKPESKAIPFRDRCVKDKLSGGSSSIADELVGTLNRSGKVAHGLPTLECACTASGASSSTSAPSNSP